MIFAAIMPVETQGALLSTFQCNYNLSFITRLPTGDTRDEDWPVEGYGVSAWSKTEPGSSRSASPHPVQEGENAADARGHPWGSQAL